MKTEPPNRIPEGESIVLKNQGPPGAIVVCRKTADGQEVVLDVEKTCDYSAAATRMSACLDASKILVNIGRFIDSVTNFVNFVADVI